MAGRNPLPQSRTVLLLVVAALLLTVGAGVTIVLARRGVPPAAGASGLPFDETARAVADAQRLLSLLMVLLISALLILMFVLGSYLVIRMGHYVARERLGGKPTEYVDAWQNYRLTDDQIAAATDEDEPPRRPRDDPDAET